MKISIVYCVAIVLLLSGCVTAPFQASSGMLTEGNALFAQGRYPQASSVYKKCLEIEQNPACLYNIGMMIETSRYNDPDPAVRASMYADGKTPRGRAVQYYHLAARYGQPDAIAALKRLNRTVPPDDLAQAMVAQSQQSQMSPETQQALGSLAQIVGCMLAGGTSCGVVPIVPARQRAQPQDQHQPQLPSSQPPFVASSLPPPVQAASAGSCVMNSECSFPARCIKAPGNRTGVCGVEVDEAGVRTYQNTGTAMGCRFNTDCGVGFTCQREQGSSRPGVCVKR